MSHTYTDLQTQEFQHLFAAFTSLSWPFMHGFGCYVRKKNLKQVSKKRRTETREERETPKQQRNKYSVESANCNVSPTRQRLLLLTGEICSTCVQSNDHWPTTGKNNPHPCAQIISLICVCLSAEERERCGVHRLPSNDFIWQGIKDREIRFYSI